MAGPAWLVLTTLLSTNKYSLSASHPHNNHLRYMQQKKKEFLRKFPLKEWEELDQASGSSDNLYKNIPKVWLHDFTGLAVICLDWLNSIVKSVLHNNRCRWWRTRMRTRSRTGTRSVAVKYLQSETLTRQAEEE